MKTNDVEKKTGERHYTVKELLSLVTPVFVRYRGRLLIGFLAILGVDFLQLTVPRILKSGVDGISENTITTGELGILGLYILAIAVVVGVLRFLWRNLIIGFSRLLEKDIRERIFSHVLKMDSTFFEKRTTGDIMAHISNDLSAVQLACGMGLVAAVDAVVMSTAAIVFMMFINVKLTLLALLPMPILAICTRYLSGRLHKRFTVVQEQFGSLTEFARSTLISIRLIKAYGNEKFQGNKFDRLGKKYVKSNLKVAMIQGLLFPTATLVGNLGLLAVLFYGGILVIEGEITIGGFVAFTTYLYMLIWPIMAVGWVANLVQRGLTSLDRIKGLLSEQSLLLDKQDDAATQLVPEIGLQNLSFGYPTGKIQVLHDINLSVQPGILGVTGPTGGGKSTLCKLLARLYPVDDGSLLLGGTDVNKLSLDAVREMIGYAGQEPVLFSDSIKNNIGFVDPDATEEQIVHYAKLAGVHEDIMSFSEGYEAVIGERGVTLSGGQRQRVALARALLCERPILIIDDGLSAVDVETEHQVFTSLREHVKGKTVIIVSHRLKLLSMTDRIIILDDGRITHQGTHQALLEESPFYQSMHEKHMRETREPLMEGAP